MCLSTMAAMDENSPIAFFIDHDRVGSVSESRVPGHETGQRATRPRARANAMGGCGRRAWRVVLLPLWGG